MLIINREIKKTIPFMTASKRIYSLYLGINLGKGIKDLHLKNYKTIKKLKKIQINGSRYGVHG